MSLDKISIDIRKIQFWNVNKGVMVREIHFNRDSKPHDLYVLTLYTA